MNDYKNKWYNLKIKFFRMGTLIHIGVSGVAILWTNHSTSHRDLISVKDNSNKPIFRRYPIDPLISVDLELIGENNFPVLQIAFVRQIEE